MILCRAIVAGVDKSRGLIKALSAYRTVGTSDEKVGLLKKEDFDFLQYVTGASNRKELYECIKNYPGPFSKDAYSGLMAALFNYYNEALVHDAARYKQLCRDIGKTEPNFIRIWGLTN